ncbi:growth hormone receptor-like isoform X2 [Eleginops maclovinus]|uniref:growth hormone receptor-like isoform X2 n=1 Tax=Eleginops maclovinus TaxID=56733 RepID=UPI00308093DF
MFSPQLNTMAAVLTMLLFFLLHISTTSAQEYASEQVLPRINPHFTGCVSANMETFRCRWNVGTSKNLSEPGDLCLFYKNTEQAEEWRECPHYSADRPNECFFNENHTSLLLKYEVQLRSRDQDIVYEENRFELEDILRPDPPVGLNWTLRNVTDTDYHIILGWKPPPSSVIMTGWISLQYEVQYRNAISDKWKALDLVRSTHRSIFGLQTNGNHEIRVRCKMLSGKQFGEFSESVFVHVPSKVLPEVNPQLTGCVSNNMETFRCKWNAGTSRIVSEPGNLRLFYITKKLPHASPKDWRECPHYSTERPNECFFNQNHTSVWLDYRVQLRSRDQDILYDENRFQLQEIVQPDPPVSLNWTLLNVSMTGNNFDIMLRWKPPPSADVTMGWMTLQYEVQYRDANSDQWEALDLVRSIHRSIFGLQTNANHEMRVRCMMLAGKEFGEFSDSVIIHVPSKVSGFPLLALLIFGALCLVTILMLVIISQQEKLMVILLPPVPGPKIKGIDPELLKKGKLRELRSILGGPPDLRSELYNKDPWVEFIDLDIEEQSDRLTDLDTDCLMERSLTSNCSPLSTGFRDDDSGRASCCDPDLPCELEPSPFIPLIPNITESSDSEETSLHVPNPNTGEHCFAAPGREALYTQVSEVRSSGKVLLSPEDKTELGKSTSRDGEKGILLEKKKELQLLVVNPDHGGYTSELNAGKRSPRVSSGDMGKPFQTAGDSSSTSSLSPYHESDTTTLSPLPPAPVYTMVECVNRQNSLLLTPNSTPNPQLIIPKIMPTPGGYLTPELLGSVTP